MASSDDDSCRIRQSLEYQAIEAIFTSQINKIDGEFDSDESWAPLRILVTLVPPNTYTVTPDCPTVDIEINCGYNYPNDLPEIKIVKWTKIPNKDIRILDTQIVSHHESWKGKEMIYELCNLVGEFLGYYSSPKYVSFHDEMINRQKALDLMIAQENAAKKEKEMAEIQERREKVRKALRRKSYSKDASFEESHETEGSSSEEPAKSIPLETEKDQDWTLLAASKSRFHSDFDLISWLGAGSYGRVAKVRNKVDDRYYAIKEIKLDMSNKYLNKTIIREVKLLSRLNHENVVRYYNSWFETDHDESSSSNTDNEGAACVSSKSYQIMEAEILRETKSFFFKPSYHSDESDNIYFEGSVCDESDDNEESTVNRQDSNKRESYDSGPQLLMYIQMELCDRSTLRTEIDKNDLYKHVERSLRLFREIVEGLFHIHQLCIIHRDLKPGNIFISDNDHIKIGDFGLATSVRFKGAQIVSSTFLPQSQETRTSGTTHSANVGTYYYTAPEVANKTSHKNYNQKVDIFSLGIIFFEMNHRSFETGMERYKILTELASEEVIIPESFPHGPTSSQYKLVKWMLNHNAKERPSASDLLSSHYLPPPVLEESEIKDIISKTLENPQSKMYKYMMEACFSQCFHPAVCASFNFATWRSVPFLNALEIVSEKLRGIFHRHGAVSCLPPLLIPAIDPPINAECLMTRDGTIVYPACDIRTPFARILIENSPVNNFKRYAIDKVYEARPVGLHPKEIYQCSFDIVTSRQQQEDLGVEIDLLSVIWEILNEFPQLINKNCVMYLNHSEIVKAMFHTWGISETSKINDILRIIEHAQNECATKQEFLDCLGKVVYLPEHLAVAIYNWASVEGSVKEVSNKAQTLIKNEVDWERCTMGFNYLQKACRRCDMIGINISLKVKLGVFQTPLNNGLIVQVECFTNSKMKSINGNVLFKGGNYDSLLDEMKVRYAEKDEKVTQSVCGFVLYVEKLITAVDCQSKCPLVDIILFSLGAVTWTPGRMKFATELWRSGLKVTYVRVGSMEETQVCASFYGASFIIIMKESDHHMARLKSVTKEWKYVDKNLHFSDVLEYLNSVLKAPGLSWASKHGVETLAPGKKNIVIIFVEHEFKLRKQTSSSINSAMMSFSEKLSNSTKIVVLAVPLSRENVIHFASELEIRAYNLDPCWLERKFPKLNKKGAGKILDELEKHEKDASVVLVLYSIPDAYYKPLVRV